jgi:hypothetical protein
MIVALLLAAGVTATPVPTYLVERLVTLNGATVRLSVFRDQVAVLARESGDGMPKVRRRRLTGLEYSVVEQVVRESYEELSRHPESPQGPGEGTVEYRLAPTGEVALRLKRPLTAVPSLASARLDKALDGLMAEMEEGPAGRQDLSSWEPREGDRVLLDDGRVVEVLEVLDAPDGPVARIGSGPLSEYVSVRELRSQAVRKVP